MAAVPRVMVARVEGAGVELAYDVQGEPGDPSVVLVHGMASDRAAWRCFVLAGTHVVAYDRRGYGDSGAPEPYLRTTISEQAEDLAAVVEALDLAPVVACGVDVGALAVLDVLRRHAGLIRGAVLVEPPVLQLVPEAMEALAAERAAIEEAIRADGPAAGVEAWSALHSGAHGSRDPAAFFADFGAAATLELTRRDLRAIDVPIVVLDGSATPPHARVAADAVARLLPQARRGGAEELESALRSLVAAG